VTALQAMPFQQSLVGPDGGEVRIVHASMLGTRNGIFVWTTDEELRHKTAPSPQVICVGHTHWPLIRRVDDTLVINVGSAGLPFDGDDRLSYAQLTWHRGAWQAELIRLPYDKARNKQDFYDSGFMHNSGDLAPLVLNELHTAQPRLYGWTMTYEKAVLNGEISLAESVQRFLQDLER
jgi:hypothetical protein